MIGLTPRERDLAAADADQRAGYIESTRGVEVFLAVHLEVPVPNITRHEFMIADGSDEDMIAKVDGIAAGLGETARWDHGRYVARRDFGNGVIYEAIAFPRAVPVAVQQQWSVAA